MLRAFEVMLAVFLLVCCGIAALLLIAAIASSASAPQQAALASMAIGIVAAPSAALGAIRFLRQ